MNVVVAWNGPEARLRIEVPAGQHLAPDAYVDLHGTVDASAVEVSVAGAMVGAGLGLPDVRGHSLGGTLDLSLCEDVGDACRRVSYALAGTVPSSKKGSLALDVDTTAAHAAFDASAYKADAAKAAADGFAAAAAADQPVLLDFTAVWCPPCNRFAAEVLHAADRPLVLDGFVVVQVDVDDPSSWALKDRYDVTGYPTILAANADGTERGRIVGYENRGATVDWLQTMRDGTLATELAAGPAAATPERAAVIARTLAGSTGDPAPWLARAAAGPDGVELRRARLAIAPTVDDARWLAVNWHGHALEWVPDALDLKDEPGAREVLRAALSEPQQLQDPLAARGPELGSADASLRASLADPLAYLALLAETDEERRVFSAGAATVLRSVLTGDLVADRPFVTDLADLTADSGDVDGAVALLERASATFPGDPTFLLTQARILNGADRGDAALAAADRGLPLAWGDNQLRLAKERAIALVKLGRPEEAREFVTATLASQPAPADGVDVRTNRYRTALEKVVAPP